MIVFDLRLFQKEIAEQGSTLSDAISNLGIMQIQNNNGAVEATAGVGLANAQPNAVINSGVVGQAEQMALPQQ